MTVSIRLLCILLLLAGSIAQASDDVDENPLPIGFTEEELTRLHEIGMDHVTTAPPTGSIRNSAEWERSQGVIIRYPFGISYAIIAEMSEDLMVTTIVASSSQQSSVLSYYAANGVNLANCDFLIASTNTYWTRDYGPWFIFEEGGDMAIVDPIYNRPRPQDDVIPQALGTAWGLNVFGMPLATPGGNHMSDGLGMSISTELVYNENTSFTHAEVDSIMLAYLGNDYTVLDYIESGGIHHIDVWAKFLSPTTIMVKDVSASNSSYALLNARADQLSQMTSAWGEPYTVVRVYCPTGGGYTNSLILNDKVLVPIINNTYYDNLALQTYRDAMPGYEVLGFTGSWLYDDGLHCRTMGVPDSNMLWIVHVPLPNQSDTINDYEVSATIIDHSDAGLIPDSLKIFYSINEAPFEFTPLFATANPDSFHGYIPAQSGIGEVAYYIQAADNSGRVETHPFIGAAGAHQFSIELPPELQIVETEIYDSLQPGDISQRFVRVKNNGGGLLYITFTADDAWLSCDLSEQVIFPADSLDFEMSIAADQMAYGDNLGSLDFTCNDGGTPSGSIPVYAHLYTPDIFISETSIDENLEGGDSSTYQLVIFNNGPGRLDFEAVSQMFQNKNSVAGSTSKPAGAVRELLGYHPVEFDKSEVAEPLYAPMRTDYGGPDGYGHFWVDSDEPGGPSYSWIDISASGAEVTLGDDEATTAIPIGFDFPYYDSVYSDLYIGSNGIVAFDAGNGSRTNSGLPDTNFTSLIAMWWDDLDPRQGGNIYYYSDAANERFIVSFEDIRFYSGISGTGSLNFQLILKPDGAIMLQYGVMDPGSLNLESATVGIQNSEADDALEVVYNAAYMHDNLAIQITAEHWLSVSPAGGSIEPFGSASVDVKFSAADLETGLYSGQVLVSSNDPDTPSWSLPVSLTVTAWVCGDINNSGSGPDIGDLVYLVDFMFNGGPPPPVEAAADVDGANGIDIADLVYLVDFMFNQGSAPTCP